jgi:hypothetical protein
VENHILVSPGRLAANQPHHGTIASHKARAHLTQEIQQARNESRFFRSQALAEIKAVRSRRHYPDHYNHASLSDLRLYLRMRHKWQCHLQKLEKRIPAKAGSPDPLPCAEGVGG